MKRNDRLSRAEEKQKLAEAAKTNAEARAILEKSEADRVRAVVEARVELLDAVNRLKMRGGSLAVDLEALGRLLGVDPDQLRLPPGDADQGPESG